MKRTIITAVAALAVLTACGTSQVAEPAIIPSPVPSSQALAGAEVASPEDLANIPVVRTPTSQAAQQALEEWKDTQRSVAYAYLDDDYDLEDAQRIKTSVKKVAKYTEDGEFSIEAETAMLPLATAGKSLNDAIQLSESHQVVSAKLTTFEQAWTSYEAAVS